VLRLKTVQIEYNTPVFQVAHSSVQANHQHAYILFQHNRVYKRDVPMSISNTAVQISIKRHRKATRPCVKTVSTTLDYTRDTAMSRPCPSFSIYMNEADAI